PQRKLTGRQISFDPLFSLIERILPWLSVLFFLMGIGIARISEPFAYSVSNIIETFIDSYSYIAPVVIFLILTPTLIKMFSNQDSSGNKFAFATLRWFVGVRILACLYAVIATTLLFGFPWFFSTSNFTSAITESLTSLAWMLTNSVYFYAIYVSIIVFVIAMRVPLLANFLSRGVDWVEYVGRLIIPLIPFFMLGIGAYVTILPAILTEELGTTTSTTQVNIVNFAGIPFDISTSWGMIALYASGALATGIVCGFWQIGLLILAKRRMPSFSLRDYFSKYWVRIYPLLWATSSEALSTPLNLYLVKTIFPQIRNEVRQFVVGTGSILNINGTMINVFLMTGMVAAMMGLDISFLHLLLSLPIVIIIGYGVPGIPGELVLFGGPIAHSIGVPPELLTIFLSLYVGLQIGLPDSFRTAANSTDECVMAAILNDQY
ncbi:MAG: cation:dicarboxylase symporter family transporter, partial [Chloroflexota bacterium]